MSETLVRVDAPHFVAGLLIENDRVVRAAPILAWTIGKPFYQVEMYAKRSGWVVERGHGAVSVGYND